MCTKEKEQAELLRSADEPDMYFDFRFPVWRCPTCNCLNRYADTFGEMCTNCREDHTSDWELHIVNPTVKTDWAEDSAG